VGYEVRFRPSGGAHGVGATSFDVVVTDMHMPVMDGATLLAEVRQRNPTAARIILSGYSDPEAVTRAALVAHRFLAKPCSTDVLKETMEHICTLKLQTADVEVREAVAGTDVERRIGTGPLSSASPDLLLQIHRDGTILAVHAPQEQPTAIAADLAEGILVYEALPPVLAEQLMDFVLRALEADEPQWFRYKFRSVGVARHREVCVWKRGEEDVLCIERDLTGLESMEAA
jgi:CheY-like chemotaxis protein